MDANASTSMEDEIETHPRTNISEIKNKQLRHEMYIKLKQEKRKVLRLSNCHKNNKPKKNHHVVSFRDLLIYFFRIIIHPAFMPRGA